MLHRTSLGISKEMCVTPVDSYRYKKALEEVVIELDEMFLNWPIILERREPERLLRLAMMVKKTLGVE